MQTAWGKLPGQIFMYLAKDILKKRGSFERNFEIGHFKTYINIPYIQITSRFSKLAQLYLQVLCTASFSQSAALTCNFITQENKITVLLIQEHR